MSADDPRPLADTAEALAAMADPHAYRQYIAGALPAPPASPFARVPSRVQARDEPCADPAACDLPGHGHAVVPSWVRDRAKWLTLSRAERRALRRHHERQQRGR